MLKVGLTGGIGSGKSTVAKIFEVLGIPVYYADEEAKRLMNEDEELKQKIQEHFGEATYNNGLLNRKFLADMVFHDTKKLQHLNELVHPATINDANRWFKIQNATYYAIKEAALIFESGSHDLLDYVIGVYSPQQMRIQRAMQRDNTTQEEIISRMNRQIDEEIKMRLCNFVIKNDEQQLLIPQVLAIHEKLMALSQPK